MQDYICIDLETTGLDPKTDRIIEIGAVKVLGGQVTDRFQTFVDPGRILEEKITELTGITDEDLAGAPALDTVFGELMEFCGDLPLLGHSVLFDYSFLKKAAVDRKKSFERQGVDTLKIARKYLADLESRSLKYLCEYYKIPHKAHRALEDAESTHILYGKLRELFYNREDPLFTPAPLLFQVKRDQPATKAQKERLYRMVQVHNITLPVEIESLTRSEASRLTDHLLSSFRQVNSQ